MTSLQETKDALLRQFARVGRACASPARLELLDLLAQGEKPVETLARQARLSVTNASNHLRELRLTGLALTRREGQQVFYRLASPLVYDLLAALKAVARAQLAEVRELVHDAFERPELLEPVGAVALLDRVRAAEVVVLDVRPADEYAAGHIPGAVSLPLADLERRLAELPTDREIVAYCRGPYCVLAVQAVDLLRRRGLRARRLAEGLPEWRARGLPVASPAA